MNFNLKLFVLTSLAVIGAEGSNQLRGADNTYDIGFSKNSTDDIGAVAEPDTKVYIAASKIDTDDIGDVAKNDTEDYVAASKTAASAASSSNDTRNSTGGYEVYANSCLSKQDKKRFKLNRGFWFKVDEGTDMEPILVENGGECTYIGHSKHNPPKITLYLDPFTVFNTGTYGCISMGDAFLSNALCGKHSLPSNAILANFC